MEPIVTRAAFEPIVTRAAVDDVVAAMAIEEVVAALAADRVVSTGPFERVAFIVAFQVIGEVGYLRRPGAGAILVRLVAEHEIIRIQVIDVEILKPYRAPAMRGQIDDDGVTLDNDGQITQPGDAGERAEVDYVTSCAEVGDRVVSMTRGEYERIPGAGAGGKVARHRIVARAALYPVAAEAAFERIVAASAKERVVALAAGQGVVARVAMYAFVRHDGSPYWLSRIESKQSVPVRSPPETGNHSIKPTTQSRSRRFHAHRSWTRA